MIDTLTDFLNGITEHPDDWFRWSVLADWFADCGDEVGESWARWVEKNKRRPEYNASTSLWYFDDKKRRGVYESDLPILLSNKYYDLILNEVYVGRNTAAECYELLLTAWRSFSEEDRYSFEHWSEAINA